jgi:hypothetical protein
MDQQSKTPLAPRPIAPVPAADAPPKPGKPTRYGDWERKGICVDF